MRQSPQRVAIIGDGAGAARCALVLARLGAEITILSPSLNPGSNPSTTTSVLSRDDTFLVRPLLLEAAGHPRITFHTNTKVDSMGRRRGQWYVRATRNPCYVRSDLCMGCGECTTACSVQVSLMHEGKEVICRAIHAPVDPGAVLSAYSIEKHGIPPCSAACPLGINVQGFVSLLANGKVDAALGLIHEAAPLAGVLGRVCTHPCEEPCKRGEVDAPVFIKALHRYAADHGCEETEYRFTAAPGSKKEKIAIVGSGPAGLAAAWELARRGYSPVIYESHAVVGGMLATGIPRFRLPREIREKEVKAIERMGVKIRTGVTIGRDVTIGDLRERGYRAFFLAIGAHENRRLDIPGEDIELKGVTDCTSFLFELNYGEGVSVGRNMVVIGGGNSAIDSARTAMRKGKRKVTILYRRSAAEMTAIKEDVEEALNEGVSIQYLTSPIEILHGAGKVTGIRCQRMQLGEIGKDGRRKAVSLPGSEFVMEADHVVLAIGQRPDSARLNLKALKIDGRSATIMVDPLTLETGIDGIFAGGDCVSGPNTVVDAIAQGLRAAESIDRYLRGRSVRKGRSLISSQPVSVNVREKTIVGNKRVDMPVIPHAMRMETFEETNTGLSPELVEKESVRCLNCAVCSGCMECERACKVDAVAHDDCKEEIRVVSNAVIQFVSSADPGGRKSAGAEFNGALGWRMEKEDFYRVELSGHNGACGVLEQASLVALEVFSRLKVREEIAFCGNGETVVPGDVPTASVHGAPAVGHRAARTGVVLCRCGDSISSVIDLGEVARRVRKLPEVGGVYEIAQACSEEGARKIALFMAESRSTGLVLAACRCCNLTEVCFNCNNRRVLCSEYLNRMLPEDLGAATQYVNIREHCAWVHSDRPAQATDKATDLISASLAPGARVRRGIQGERSIQQSVLVLGNGICSLSAAKKIAQEGFPVSLVSCSPAEPLSMAHLERHQETREELRNDLKNRGVRLLKCPSVIGFSGTPGNYEISLRYDSGTTHVTVGSVIACVDEMNRENCFQGGIFSDNSLLTRILRHRIKQSGGFSIDEDRFFRALSFEENSGIFVTFLAGDASVDRRCSRGGVLAAQVLMYLSRDSLLPRANAAEVESSLCRGCEECSLLCPLIEMRQGTNGAPVASIDPTLCLGCGACVSCCPTGAIMQHVRGDEEVVSMMRSLLSTDQLPVEDTWGNL